MEEQEEWVVTEHRRPIEGRMQAFDGVAGRTEPREEVARDHARTV